MPFGCKLGEDNTTASHLLVVVLSRQPSPAFHLWAKQGLAAWLMASEDTSTSKYVKAVIRILLNRGTLGHSSPVSFEYVIFIKMFFSLIRVNHPMQYPEGEPLISTLSKITF
jgi:hypothetical protein